MPEVKINRLSTNSIQESECVWKMKPRTKNLTLFAQTMKLSWREVKKWSVISPADRILVAFVNSANQAPLSRS